MTWLAYLNGLFLLILVHAHMSVPCILHYTVHFIVIIITIIIIILVITFMQGIYNYIPETNHVSRVHGVAAVLCIQFVLHVMLFRP
jgi:hypothetical protein